MRSVSMKEAAADLASLARAASAGEEIVIVQEDGPALRLVPQPDAGKAPQAGQGRRLGVLKGRVRISDDFDDPLPEDILKAFYGEGP